MAGGQAGEKTEKPTTRRLKKSRQQGQVAQSQELPAVASLLVLLLVLMMYGPDVLQWSADILRRGLSCDVESFRDIAAFSEFFNDLIVGTIAIMVPFFLGLFVIGIASSLVVGGMTWSLGPLKWKLSAISPIKGTKNMFSVKSFVKLLLSIGKIVFVAAICWFYMREHFDTFVTFQWLWPADFMAAISGPVLAVSFRICIALFIMAALDVAFQKWKHMKDMMMTKQEVKEEHKNEEGSPEIKGKRRQLQMQMAQKRMLEEVPQANVILVNPTHVAVALKYDSATSSAPIVVAKGGDHLCEKIKEIGRAHGVAIIRKPKLARALFATVKVDHAIPESLFTAVAEVLAMIYRLRNGRR